MCEILGRGGGHHVLAIANVAKAAFEIIWTEQNATCVRFSLSEMMEHVVFIAYSERVSMLGQQIRL